ncbi:hypothetical protein [Vibrio profundi]|uniref:hypothetical protein n=1 Tax=Vibrio profundi TaxID=1774960 RepID=UPI0037364F9E
MASDFRAPLLTKRVFYVQENTDCRFFGDDSHSVVVTGNKNTAITKGEADIPTGAEVIDGEGRTLMPALVDAHMHLTIPVVQDPLIQKKLASAQAAFGSYQKEMKAGEEAGFDRRAFNVDCVGVADTCAKQIAHEIW